ncbi:hypothetical protein WN48_01079 [Eufriesea mexicana]|nr:hypothetical protein WN48_01079 [Eufriesea mexicana]
MAIFRTILALPRAMTQSNTVCAGFKSSDDVALSADRNRGTPLCSCSSSSDTSRPHSSVRYVPGKKQPEPSSWGKKERKGVRSAVSSRDAVPVGQNPWGRGLPDRNQIFEFRGLLPRVVGLLNEKPAGIFAGSRFEASNSRQRVGRFEPTELQFRQKLVLISRVPREASSWLSGYLVSRQNTRSDCLPREFVEPCPFVDDSKNETTESRRRVDGQKAAEQRKQRLINRCPVAFV